MPIEHWRSTFRGARRGLAGGRLGEAATPPWPDGEGRGGEGGEEGFRVLVLACGGGSGGGDDDEDDVWFRRQRDDEDEDEEEE